MITEFDKGFNGVQKGLEEEHKEIKMGELLDLIEKVPGWISRASEQIEDVRSMSDVRLVNLAINKLHQALLHYQKGMQYDDLNIHDNRIEHKESAFRYQLSKMSYADIQVKKGWVGYKIDGIPIEIARFLIRIFHMMLLNEFAFNDFYKNDLENISCFDTFIYVSSQEINNSIGYDDGMRIKVDEAGGLSFAIMNTLKFCIDNNIDIEKAIELELP